MSSTVVFCDHGSRSLPPFHATRAEAPSFCPVCASLVPEESGINFRVEAQESIGSDRHDARTNGVNLGLRGQMVDGKYRPMSASEASSAWKTREIAKRQGLTMVDGPHYRTVGQRRIR